LTLGTEKLIINNFQMSIAIIAPNKDVTEWKLKFLENDPSVEIQIFPEINNPSSVEVVLLWNHPEGILLQFPNLKLICSMGAGVDHIMRDKLLPTGIPISRVVDPLLTQSMTQYVIAGILNYKRQFFRYLDNKRNKIWDMSNPELDVTVGVIGVGELGTDVIDKLISLKINVLGYGNNPKNIQKYDYFCGNQLNDFLARVNLIVCLLPLTSQTENFLNIDLFRKCKKGTFLINAARGKHLIDEDLLLAIEEGYISGALLDVFRTEPLPKSHPFWENEKVFITPHIASVTNPDAAVKQIVENYKNIKNNKSPKFLIDITKGY
jgi:glyoxylate/hydroxypyruvate reductase